MRISKKFGDTIKSVCLTLILLSTIVIFQNCGENSLPAEATSASIATASASSAAAKVTATYAPNPATLSSAITITPTGGTAPYTYTLVAGAGTLAGNIYVSPAAAETALISIVDSAKVVGAVTIVVGGTAATTTGTTATPTPSPTPFTTSIAGTAIPPNGTTFVPRSCNLATLLAAGQAAGTSSAAAAVPPAVNYEFCLVLSRAPTSAELSSNSVAVEKCTAGPLNVLMNEFNSTEAQSLYGYTSMTPTNFVTFMFRLNLVRDPSSTELATYVNMLNSGNSQSGVYGAFVGSSTFMSGQPYIKSMVDLWDEYYDEGGCD